MATRHFTSTTADSFEKVSNHPDVVNASGQLSPYTVPVARPEIPQVAPGPRPGRKAARLIDAQSGQALGEETEKATVYAANKASIRRTIDRSDMGAREEEYLRAVLGAPRSDRA